MKGKKRSLANNKMGVVVEVMAKVFGLPGRS